MDNIIVTHSMLEKLIHPNYMFPISEFIDYFDTFSNGGFPSHWHPEIELHIVLKGRAEYTVNGVPYVLEEGCAIYIAPESIHLAKQLTKGTISYNIVLLPQLLVNLMESIHCEEYSHPLTTRLPEAFIITPERKEGYKIIKYLKVIYGTENTHNNIYELILLEYLIGIWRNLLALFPKQTFSPDSKKTLRDQRMKTMLNYIHENYSSPISIEDIAASANVSKSECFRCFTELSSTTPSQYINDYRLLQASQLLLTTEKNVSDICYMTGFNNTSYFSKKFKIQYGMSPKLYRSQKSN